MRRSIFNSMLVIAAVTTVAVSGGTFAPITDQATGSGNVAGGDVDVAINGVSDGDSATIVFSTEECTEMAPGHTCTSDTLTISNPGTLSANWAITIADDEALDADCFQATMADQAALQAGDGGDDHDPADSHNTTLQVTMNEDGNPSDINECQGATAEITLTVDATQSATPHD